MGIKTVRLFFSCLLVIGLGVVCAPMVGAIPSGTVGSGPLAGGTTVSGMAPCAARIAGGEETGYALDVEGGAWAWGGNAYGQLGNGTTTDSLVPVRVAAASGALPPFTAIAAGQNAGYALDVDGGAWAWGRGEVGQLGDGAKAQSERPVQLAVAFGALPQFTAIAAGHHFGLALDLSGGVWGWGENIAGQLGKPAIFTGEAWPEKVQAASGSLPPFTAIAAGIFTGHALDVNGRVWGWGAGSLGQLGNGLRADDYRPTQVEAASGTLPVFTAIAAGNASVYALDVNGGVWAWGQNDYGELGNGNTTLQTRPVQVQAASGTLPVITAIAAGRYTGYALDEDGGMWAWGRGDDGELGNDTTTDSSRAVQVKAASGTLPRFATIAAGFHAGYAVDDKCGIWAWGFNSDGQLGDGTTTRSLTPLEVVGIPLASTVGNVTFAGVAGTGLSQSGGLWSVTTPAGCGPAPVEVWFGSATVQDRVANVGVFEFGQPPGIGAQPASGVVAAGETFTAVVGVFGDPVPSVRWQSRIGAGGWVDIPGASGMTLTTRPSVTTQYRAVATNCWSVADPAHTAVSSTALVSVSSPSSSAPSSPATTPTSSPSPQTKKVTSVALAMKKVTMKKRTSLKAVSLAYPVGLGAKLSWTSSNPKVAKVNAKGKITALKPGRAVITAKAESGKRARLKVTVVAKATKAKTVKAAHKSAGVRAPSPDKIIVKKGKSARLTVAPGPAKATLKKMPTFRSTKPKVASVDKTGLVTTHKKGKAKVTVKLAGKKTAILIHVV
ncbi:MAG: Ig-like domain-containing protein [Micrococcales bacterium]|nr:Ig-like domain-containing protein [Micrococcales bacterium]